MALQIWLPLNGNLDNQGLSRVTVTNNGATVDNTGKIGKCYSFDGSSSYVSTDCNMYFDSGTKGSFSMWLYPTVNNCAIIGSQNFQVQVYIGSDNKLWFNQWNVSGVNSLRGASSVTLNLNTWTHICFTWDGTEMSMYLNGTFNTKFTALYDTHKTGNFLNIGGNVYMSNVSGASRFFSGKINDFRVYDHCLSAKEVKDISKGLVMHYKLNMPNPNLLPVSSQRMTESGQTSTNEYLNICSIFDIIETYGLVPLTISFDIKAAVNQGFSLYGNYGTGNKYMFTGKTIQVSTEWQRITYTFTPWLQNESGTWAGISVYGAYGSGAIVSVRRVKLELGTKATPFEAGFNVATDCSGYKNHGIVSSTRIESIPNSPKHSTALKLGYNTYINAGTGAKVKDAITVSCWASMSNWSSFNSRLISCTEGGGWNFEPSSTKMNFACGTGVSRNTYKSVATVTPFVSMSSGWHHFVGTYDGFKTKIYLDGVLENTNNAYTTKTPLYYNANNSILIGAEAAGGASPAGSYFVSGGLSDIRIYATALSEEDVKELYETSAFTDDKGTIDAYDFVERRLSIANEDVPDLDSTGVLHTKSFIEHTTLDAMIFKDRVEASRFVEI